MNMPEATQLASSYLDGLAGAEDPRIAIETPMDFVPHVGEAAKRMAVELEGIFDSFPPPSHGVSEPFSDLESRIKTLASNINSQFNDLRQFPYSLHSVIIHRGDVSSGHYWIYIYDFTRKLWLSYNDETVKEVDRKAVFEPELAARPATSCFLVYVQEGLETNLTESVHRDIVNSVAKEHDGDVEMANTKAADEKLGDWATSLKDSSGDVVMQDSGVNPQPGRDFNW